MHQWQNFMPLINTGAKNYNYMWVSHSFKQGIPYNHKLIKLRKIPGPTLAAKRVHLIMTIRTTS